MSWTANHPNVYVKTNREKQPKAQYLYGSLFKENLEVRFVYHSGLIILTKVKIICWLPLYLCVSLPSYLVRFLSYSFDLQKKEKKNKMGDKINFVSFFSIKAQLFFLNLAAK